MGKILVETDRVRINCQLNLFKNTCNSLCVNSFQYILLLMTSSCYNENLTHNYKSYTVLLLFDYRKIDEYYNSIITARQLQA